jgi:hypothetical protein
MSARAISRLRYWTLLALFAAVSAVAQAATATLTAPSTTLAATGGSVTLTATINYTGQTLTTLGWTINLPTGWSYASSGGTNVPSFPPVAGDTVQLDWAYLDPSVIAGSAQFTTTLNYVAGLTGNQTITAVVNYKVSGNSTLQSITLPPIALTTASTAPVISVQPSSQSVAVGANATLTVAATGGGTLTYQWQKNGRAIPGATTSSLALSNVQPVDAALYAVLVTGSGGTTTSRGAVVGVTTTEKVVGAGSIVGTDITHANGNIYDQVLLTGSTATITADPGQVTRLSFIDLTDDIVQVEMSGAGTLTISLENATGPAVATKYNQPTVAYMKGHASLVMTGANETTNVSVFSVGTINAVNQALFLAGTTYDGVADIGLLSIGSTNGKFGGIRTANANYTRTAGLTGVYAPGVAVQGPTYIGDITADAEATGSMVFASTPDVWVTGGDLLQLNNRAVQVDGITQVLFKDGVKSNGSTLPAQANRGRLEQNGVDVTSLLVK